MRRGRPACPPKPREADLCDCAARVLPRDGRERRHTEECAYTWAFDQWESYVGSMDEQDWDADDNGRDEP